MNAATQAVVGAREQALATRVSDIAQLLKLRVTALVVMTGWTGFYMGAAKTGTTSLNWELLHALLGIGLVSGGASALNQLSERALDERMLRTAARPLPARRMKPSHALAVGLVCILAGSAYLALAGNPLTGVLALLTAAAYVFAYTPLKTVSTWSTFVGAFPGAMPPLLGWTAVRGAVEAEALVLFAMVFLWQFPHFLAIAWLYREDYERAGIRMLPVVHRDGRATIREILAYGALLVPVSAMPTFVGMAGPIYWGCALLLSLAYFWYGVRLARLRLSPADPASKPYARQLLKASVIYLPILFAVLMLTAR